MEERHFLVGTAGHVDHGKTELIRAMSGIDTDRLKEEKLRGISIELGFAHMVLPSGRRVGIVDVPGHERFVRQMLAGASGMDLVLLVIAADEGIMPQTAEHLSILSLLGIDKGFVVLNKIDLVDREWLELMEEEIKEGLQDTPIATWPVYAVSAMTKEGIPQLMEAIDKALAESESKQVSGPVRMPIDRVFTVAGFGTVVTGTLHSGEISLGQEMALEPGHLSGKVRSLQVHSEKVEKATAGQRVAVNLSGIDVAAVEKGATLVTPKAFSAGNILDLKVLNLATADKPIIHRQRLRFHIGTAEALGRIHLLDQEELVPGAEGYAQILLESEVVAAPGDRFVLRFYSPAHTIGGGKVLGVAALKQKRFREAVLAQMHLKDQGDPRELVLRELTEPRNIAELAAMFHLDEGSVQTILGQLVADQRVSIWPADGEQLFWAVAAGEQWQRLVNTAIETYQKAYPLRGGIGREELKAKLNISWSHRRWQSILEEGAKRQYFNLTGSKVVSRHSQGLPADLQRVLDCLCRRWSEAGLMPPDLDSGARDCGVARGQENEFAQYLVDRGEWIATGGIFFNSTALAKAKKHLLDFLDVNGEVAVADVRELWGTSRKYTVPLLEYFDQQKVTRRAGDKRIRFV